MALARALQVACLLLALLAVAEAAATKAPAKKVVKPPPPCSLVHSATYSVYNVEGFQQRLKKPNTTMVTLRIARDIELQDILVLNSSFSCTRIVALHPNVTTIYNLNETQPTVVVNQASHILFSGVNIKIQTFDNATNNCPYGHQIDAYQFDYPCPALMLYRANYVKVTQAQVYGRVDFIRTNNSLFDSMTVASSHGSGTLLRFIQGGEGKYLIRSNNTVSNCVFNGGPLGYSVGILLYRGAVGVNIANNEFYNFTFAGIQCGHDVHNVADCMLMRMTNNYIENDGNAGGDATGIYFDGHWFDPGNYLSCNYVVGGTHCLYLDYLTSNVVVDGMICWKTKDGVKVNGGKNNLINGLVVVDIHSPSGADANPGFINCENYMENNCLLDPGSSWVNQWYNKYYKAAPKLWAKTFPDLAKVCTETHVNGLSCNPPGGVPANVTGNCSALATSNKLNFAVVHNKTKIIYPYNNQCDPFTSFLPSMNIIQTITMTPAAAAFNNYWAGDFGITSRRSQLLRNYQGFRSCPRAKVGPQKVRAGVAAYMPL